MRWRVGSGVVLLVSVLLLAAGCITSDTPFFTDITASTPLPDAFVMVSQGQDKQDAIRFDRRDDSYVTEEDGKTDIYRLVPLESADSQVS